MPVYKVTYQVNGDATFRDVNISSDTHPDVSDFEVINAARRDSINYPPAPAAETMASINVIGVTLVI